MDAGELLAIGDLFRGLPAPELEVLAGGSEVRRLDAGEVLVRAGAVHDAVVYLALGKIALYRRNPRREVTLLLGVLEGPSLFGDAECAAGTPWMVSARAEEPSWCVKIANPTFLAVVDRQLELARRLYRDACQRHLLANHTAQTLALYDVETRLMRLLLDFAYRFGDRDGDQAVIDRRVSKVELAAALGVNRKTITRVLAPLERGGALSYDAQGRLVLHGLSRLEAELPRDLLGLSSRLGEAVSPVLGRWKTRR